MWKIARDNTDMELFNGYNNVRSVQYVLIIRASRFIALRFIIGNRCILYVLQVHRVKRGKDTIYAIGDELRKYVQQLLVIAEYNTTRIAISDELRNYVQQLLVIAKCDTAITPIGYGLL